MEEEGRKGEETSKTKTQGWKGARERVASEQTSASVSAKRKSQGYRGWKKGEKRKREGDRVPRGLGNYQGSRSPRAREGVAAGGGGCRGGNMAATDE